MYTTTQMVMFVFGTFQRGLHNFLLEFVKVTDEETGKKIYPFPGCTITLMSAYMCTTFALLLVGTTQGQEGLKKCFNVNGFKHFWIMGVLYCIDDIMEMEAVKLIDSQTYTVISQGKLMFAALLSIVVLRKNQTVLQWCILLIVTTGMFQYVFRNGVPGAGKGSHEGDAKTDQLLHLLGMALAVGKVVVSVVAAVVNQRLMGTEGSAFPIQFFWMKSSQAVFASIYTFSIEFKHIFITNGLFAGWTGVAYASLFLGFLMKAVIAIWLVKVLDAVLKNLSDALSLAAVFVLRLCVLHAQWTYLELLTYVVIILGTYAYIQSKSVEEDLQKERAARLESEGRGLQADPSRGLSLVAEEDGKLSIHIDPQALQHQKKESLYSTATVAPQQQPESEDTKADALLGPADRVASEP
uniref:Sugar phosphate transporter domain-containing protein n=1 Tax=Chromera velia CCMP2878 TaxID=1169474 RepID=A0A0G4F195_9ALVE|mmetsp:Transcript_47115/g.92976  ORF Transcript_47115/g.92976 Transcript_47115/m.92976 type:complete len:410 (+) Transcript_47115:159-1388(+)|eukprot:Cvel_14544.t1-p1 / transcript=Cvel_14544.t1 / gene=Cvel_14544 / organism=Chromera_velia_CCMP2878 / gene_product=hypothetical protein / transcript_product=hypothetical protein / location=Cvel_scaffold1039:20105-24055(-) / protein_length=409 / sequence_SO=supercontig / SO=protein_coding / is_pseudo=false